MEQIEKGISFEEVADDNAIEKPSYYHDKTRISNSSLGWFIKGGPRYFKDMLDGKEEGLSGKFLEKGTMIHMYLLQPEEFWDNYIILDFEKPSHAKHLKFCEEYSSSLELIEDVKLLEAYRRSYDNKKTPENALNEARELFNRYSSYIEYLQKTNIGKSVITFADLNTLKTIKAHVEEHKLAGKLLFDSDEPNLETHNEFHINWNIEKYGLKLKSLLDRVIIDHVNQKITLVDIKTTASINNFKKSVDEYDYYRQIVFYFHAIIAYMKTRQIDLDEWDFEAYIVAISNDNKGQIKVFDMLDDNIFNEKSHLMKNIFEKLAFHFTNDLWDYSQEYYEGNGVEKLSGYA